MHASEYNLEKLLKGDKQFVVPSFQPAYGWNEARWTAFLEGVLELYQSKEVHETFLGAIVLMPLESSPNGVKKYLIVDGQQRLITMLALVAAIRDLLKKSNPQFAKKITEHCLVNKVENGYFHFKILPNKKDRHAFFDAMNEKRKHSKSPFPATRFFAEQLEEAAPMLDMKKFYSLLLKKFMTVCIELEKDENPYPVFRSLNLSDAPKSKAELSAYHKFASDPRIMALIAGGESQQLEFKESLTGHSCNGKDIEKYGRNIVRAVSGFMNSSTGGSLLIGVQDDGIVSGINDEYAKADRGRANWDGYHLHLRNLLESRLSIENAFRFYKVSHHTLDGRDICRIRVEPADAPVYVDKRLYVRSGNQTLEMRGPDLVAYVHDHWPHLKV